MLEDGQGAESQAQDTAVRRWMQVPRSLTGRRKEGPDVRELRLALAIAEESVPRSDNEDLWVPMEKQRPRQMGSTSSFGVYGAGKGCAKRTLSVANETDVFRQLSIISTGIFVKSTHPFWVWPIFGSQ